MQHLQAPPRPHADTALQPNVDAATWQRKRDALMHAEKAHTRAGDAVTAQRKRLPMVRIDGDWVLQGPDGDTTLLDMFEGRRQLVLYHHMLKPDDAHPCPGCSYFGDGISAHLEHIHFNDATIAFIAEAPLDQIEAYKARMGWTMPFYSQFGTTFGDDVNPSPHGTGSFALSVFLRDGEDVFRTYATWGRGVEALSFGAGMLDVLPFGRQQEFEDAPEGWPQAPTYSRGGLHPDFTDEQLSGATAPSSALE
jgi:predicted dithiol-disulfide oxidoreductase (DUF899 family)